jgi:hypothetical protein
MRCRESPTQERKSILIEVDPPRARCIALPGESGIGN